MSSPLLIAGRVAEGCEERILRADTKQDSVGNLDILASFRGTQELLYDLIDCPEEVDRLTRLITQLWLRYYDELDAIIRPACRGIKLLDSDLVQWQDIHVAIRFLIHDLSHHV